MPSEILKTRLETFRKYHDWLKEARDVAFKADKPVRVSNERYHGFGLIASDESCPLDQLAVRLENGNVWWYPLEDCHAVRREDCPAWLQRVLKKDSVVSVRALKRHLRNEGASLIDGFRTRAIQLCRDKAAEWQALFDSDVSGAANE